MHPPNFLKKLKKGFKNVVKSVGKAAKVAAPAILGAAGPGLAASPIGQVITKGQGLAKQLDSIVGGGLGNALKGKPCSGKSCNAQAGVVPNSSLLATQIGPVPAGPPIIGLILGALAVWGAIAALKKS